MIHQEAIKASRNRKLVPDDKFDRHMKRARVKDIDSRKAIFDRQTERGEEFKQEIHNIKHSTY
jgi:hypothetical protein